MKCGIIGLPNVGKSTLFNCLTSLKAGAKNYPFCTIEPNRGMVKVPDFRLDELSRVFQSEAIIPASLEFVDIAGLIEGAHKGEGLGNRFLNHIRDVQVLLHVVRVFFDRDISHVQNTIDPLRDIQLIDTELLLSDGETIEKRMENLKKSNKGSVAKAFQIEMSLLKKLHTLILKEEKPARCYQPLKEEKIYFNQLGLLTSKPVLYVCNMDNVDDTNSNQSKKMIQTLESQYSKDCVFKICAISKENKHRGLNELIQKAYHLLDLITFFTAGAKESKAWTIKKNTLAPKAGGKIHSDFEKGFIRAEVYSFQDFKTLQSEKSLRANGKYRQVGRDYRVQDGDVMLFKFQLPSS